MKNKKELSGEDGIVLGNFKHNKEFYEKYNQWLKNPESVSGMGDSSFSDWKEVEKYLRKNEENPDVIHLCIYKDNEPVGDISLEKLCTKSEFSVDKKFSPEKSYEFKIMVGESRLGGIGKKSSKIFLQDFFNRNRNGIIYLSVYEDNKPAVRLYENCGFQKIKEEIEEKTGKKEYVMKLTENDWKKSKLNNFVSQ